MASIEKLILGAKALYAAYGDSLSGDKTIIRLLSAYQDHITVTNRMMRQSHIVNTCAACAEEQAGSCCMQDVEEWYDPVLLLINLLMGVELPDGREVPGHCLFVGSRGCKLFARYPFCVNYLCPRLKDLLGPSQTQNLLIVSGQELLSGWETEQSIRMWLNLHSNDLSSQ